MNKKLTQASADWHNISYKKGRKFRGTVYLINALVVMRPDRILRTIGDKFWSECWICPQETLIRMLIPGSGKVIESKAIISIDLPEIVAYKSWFTLSAVSEEFVGNI